MIIFQLLVNFALIPPNFLNILNNNIYLPESKNQILSNEQTK